MPKASQKRRVLWAIYKRFSRMPWPGDYWHGPFKSYAAAMEVWRKLYFPIDRKDRGTFIIVKEVLTQARTPAVPKKRQREEDE